jgi:hypothetical protein
MFASASAWPDSAQDTELWQRATELYAGNDHWQAGRVDVSFVQYNRKDERISSHRSVLSVAVGPDGELETTVVESYEDGTEEDKNREGPPFGDGDENAFAVLEVSPFDPDEQHRVSAEPLGRIRRLDGRTVVGYGYTVSGDGKHEAIGTAWLDQESGRPLSIEATIDPLPRYLEELTAYQRYSGPEGLWAPESLAFTARVKFLLFRRRIESSMVFSQYFQYDNSQ